MLDFAGAHEIVLQKGWLSELPSSFQHSVLDRCRLQHFSPGQPIYSVGDPPGGMYGLLSGGIGISVAPHERGPYVAHFVKPGSWFGEAAAITGEPRRVGLAATRDTVVLQLPLHAIHEIVGQDPALWRLFALATIRHLDLAVGNCDDLRRRDPVERCVATILRLAGRRTASQADSSPVEIDLSQEDIANLSNVARTTLSTVLRDLEASGQVKRSYRRICILAPNAMRARLSESPF
jgi:CRP/FNR family transcriptional regulator, cyclic AMP receptor protein